MIKCAYKMQQIVAFLILILKLAAFAGQLAHYNINPSPHTGWTQHCVAETGWQHIILLN